MTGSVVVYRGCPHFHQSNSWIGSAEAVSTWLAERSFRLESRTLKTLVPTTLIKKLRTRRRTGDEPNTESVFESLRKTSPGTGIILDEILYIGSASLLPDRPRTLPILVSASEIILIDLAGIPSDRFSPNYIVGILRPAPDPPLEASAANAHNSLTDVEQSARDMKDNSPISDRSTSLQLRFPMGVDKYHRAAFTVSPGLKTEKLIVFLTLLLPVHAVAFTKACVSSSQDQLLSRFEVSQQQAGILPTRFAPAAVLQVANTIGQTDRSSSKHKTAGSDRWQLLLRSLRDPHSGRSRSLSNFPAGRLVPRAVSFELC